MSDTSPSTATEIRPFRIDVPQGELDELRRRIDATRWPTRELVTDRSQGVQLEIVQDATCIQMMKDFIKARPELWNEDIGV